MRLVIAGDHSSPALKQALVEHLQRGGHTVRDLGTCAEASVDYPDFAEAACAEVLAGRADRAVLICGTGIGIAISANKIPGIRCGVAHNAFTGALASEHNHAQVLAIGARVLDAPTAIATVDAWLTTARSDGPRHLRRIEKITALEQRACNPKA
ncbi:MAG: RpiB/LacA/LacB family sugar-phosphate isomerase [Planctomycetota bacterium]